MSVAIVTPLNQIATQKKFPDNLSVPAIQVRVLPQDTQSVSLDAGIEEVQKFGILLAVGTISWRCAPLTCDGGMAGSGACRKEGGWTLLHPSRHQPDRRLSLFCQRGFLFYSMCDITFSAQMNGTREE